MKIASGSSFKILATMRRRKPPFRTCPRCTSLIRAALRPRNARPAGIENPVKSGDYCRTVQQFHRPMEVHVQPSQLRKSKNNPREDRSKKEKAQHTHPNRGNPVKRAQNSICVAKCE